MCYTVYVSVSYCQHFFSNYAYKHIQHEGVASPISPNSPSSASYDSNQPLPVSCHYTSSPPASPTQTANTPTLSSQAHMSPIAFPPTHIHTTLSPTPPPPQFLLGFASQTSSSTGSNSSTSGQSSYEQQEADAGGEGEGMGAFVCEWNDCNMEFPNLSYLVSHLDRGHTATMVTYRCLWKDCQREKKPFDARYKLITHLRCHTGEKPYKCDVKGCNRSFSRLENLKLHVRTHTGEKPYACHYENCNKRFNNTSDRAKHMKTHITRKPYACKIPGCTKSYTDPSSMRKHVKFAHRMREGSSESSSSSSTGSGTLWRSSRKVSSPVCLSSSPHLTSNQKSPEVQLHYPIPSLTKLPITTHSPSNRLSVIQHESSIVRSLPCSSTHLFTSPTVSTTSAAQLLHTTTTASAPTLLPLPVLQVPGLPSGSPSMGLQPVMMQIEGSDQKVIVFVPGTSIAPTFEGTVGSSIQHVVPSSLETIPADTGRPSVLVSPSQSCHSHSKPTSTKSAGGSTSAMQSQSPMTVEHQVRMRAAHLQQQLQTTYQQDDPSKSTQSSSHSNCPIQVPSTVAVTRMTVPSPLKAALAVPNIKAEAIPIGILPTPQTVQQPPRTPIVFQTATGQSVVLNTIQPQFLHTSHGTQYVQPATGFVQLPQLPNLTSINLAQTVAQPFSSSQWPSPQTNPPTSIKPFTVVTTPTQCLGFGGQTVVLPSGQMFSVVPSTTHVLMPPQTTLPNDKRS